MLIIFSTLDVEAKNGTYNEAFSTRDEARENNGDSKMNNLKAPTDIERNEAENVKEKADEDVQHCVLRNIMTLPKREHGNVE